MRIHRLEVAAVVFAIAAGTIIVQPRDVWEKELMLRPGATLLVGSTRSLRRAPGSETGTQQGLSLIRAMRFEVDAPSIYPSATTRPPADSTSPRPMI